MAENERKGETYESIANAMEHQLLFNIFPEPEMRERIIVLRRNLEKDKDYCLKLIELNDGYFSEEYFEYSFPVASD